jgi:hypothetical protein
MSDDALIREAVLLVADYWKGLKLTPGQFDGQMALCELFRLADEDPGSNVAQWILTSDRQALWKKDSQGMLVEGDEPQHVKFRAEWQEFLLEEFPVM